MIAEFKRLLVGTPIETAAQHDQRLSKRIAHCFGTHEQPMSDSLLEEKFLAQAELAIGRARAMELAALCWGVEGLPDMTLLTQKAG